MPKYRLFLLNAPLSPDGGYAWSTALPSECPDGGDETDPFRSEAVLFEDGVPLGPSHASHADVRNRGGGRFSHWKRQIIFSAGDNSIPGKNKRRYELLVVDDKERPDTEPVAPDHRPTKIRRTLPLKSPHFIHGEGHMWLANLPENSPAGDGEGEPQRSTVTLLEGGVELGPAHTPHSEIRDLGGGRYSHWGHQIVLSASDNTSPIENHRTYELLFPKDENHWLAEFETLQDPSQLIPFERFNLARRIYRKVWPYSHLPDFGLLIDSDQEFKRIFDTVCPEADYSYARKYNLDQLFKLVVGVEGDVAECGTYKGAGAYFLARHIASGKLDKRLCLFDSFEGLSSPAPADGDWWKSGDLSATVSDLKATLSPLGDLSFVDIYPGWIPARFAEVAERRFCFAHIDVDLAEPTMECLEFFYPRLAAGGIILFDDYGCLTCPGVTEVVDQFLASRPESVVNLSAGGALVKKV